MEVSTLDGIEDDGGRSSDGGSQVLGTRDRPEELEPSSGLLESFDPCFRGGGTGKSSDGC